MTNEIKKMAFYEIGAIDEGKGKFYMPLIQDVQEAFEEAQFDAEDRQGKASVILKITIEPRKTKEPYGTVEYEISKKTPPKKSTPYTTRLSADGIITSSVNSKFDPSQLQLDFNKAIIKQINEE